MKAEGRTERGQARQREQDRVMRDTMEKREERKREKLKTIQVGRCNEPRNCQTLKPGAG